MPNEPYVPRERVEDLVRVGANLGDALRSVMSAVRGRYGPPLFLPIFDSDCADRSPRYVVTKRPLARVAVKHSGSASPQARAKSLQVLVKESSYPPNS